MVSRDRPTLPAELSAAPGNLTFSALLNSGQAAGQTVSVRNTGDGDLPWSASVSQSWIHASSTNGTTPTNFIVTADPTGLAAGEYSGNITITASGGLNSPQTLSVTMRIRDPNVYTATGQVLRQGMPFNSDQSGIGLACSNVNANTSGSMSFGPVTTNAAGSIVFSNLPSGTYTFRASYSGYLNAEKSGFLVDSSQSLMNIGQTILRGGDVNADNAINILDIGTMISKFGFSGVAFSSTGTACGGPDEPADINDDSAIDISDLAILASNWGKVEPTIWGP